VHLIERSQSAARTSDDTRPSAIGAPGNFVHIEKFLLLIYALPSDADTAESAVDAKALVGGGCRSGSGGTGSGIAGGSRHCADQAAASESGYRRRRGCARGVEVGALKLLCEHAHAGLSRAAEARAQSVLRSEGGALRLGGTGKSTEARVA
jgi:hypothetical protein